MKKTRHWMGMLAALLLLPGAALAAVEAGTVTMVTGRSTASDPQTGGIRALKKGDVVYSGELLNTAANTFLNVRYRDGSYTLIRPNSRFEITDYRFQGTPAKPAPTAPSAPAAATGAQASSPLPALTAAQQTGPSRAFFRLVKGGFRAVSGAIGKATREEYQVRTPIATLGIRGTDFEVDICDAACQSDPVIQRTLQQRGLAQLDGLQLAETPEGTQSDVAMDGSTGDTEVVRVNSGGVDYTPDNGPPTTMGPGDNLLALPNGEVVPLEGQPASLSKPDPAGAACN